MVGRDGCLDGWALIVCSRPSSVGESRVPAFSAAAKMIRFNDDAPFSHGRSVRYESLLPPHFA